MPKSISLWQKYSAEWVVLSSTHTETVLPMNWKEELCDWRDVEEQTFVPSRSEHGELLMKLLGFANVTLDAES